MDPNYTLVAQVPSAADYRRLRVAAGLSPKTAAAARAGLPNSHFAIVAKRERQTVGMGRIIGDGGLFFQIVDIAVDPDHQGRGIGKAIVGALVDRLRGTAPAGAYVSLLADGGAQRLYSQFGFRPTAPESIGMSLSL